MSVSLNLMTQVKKQIVEKPALVLAEGMKALLPGVKTNVVLTICDNSYIKMLNTKYRKKYSATDVLSFPLLISKTPGKVSYSDADIDPETGEIQLGDIMVSIDKAKAQALEYGHTLERELCYLAVHSLLHLVGYDHETEADRKQMRMKEEEILKKLGVSR